MLGIVAALAVAGCGRAKIDFTHDTKPPVVRLIEPPLRKIVREVGQPSFIESYERTSIFNKPSAYIEKWIVDIGDRVKKNDVLAILFAPSGSNSSRRRRQRSCSTESESPWPSSRWKSPRPTSPRPRLS